MNSHKELPFNHKPSYIYEMEKDDEMPEYFSDAESGEDFFLDSDNDNQPPADNFESNDEDANFPPLPIRGFFAQAPKAEKEESVLPASEQGNRK